MRMSQSSSIEVDILERDDLMRDVYAPHHKLLSMVDVLFMEGTMNNNSATLTYLGEDRLD